ncbi:MAG: tyrosine-protein phosphatase [Fimbriiglobus sp.]
MKGLDYSKGCVNFRDVGECINLLAGRDIVPIGRILRGGKLEFVQSTEQIGRPGTIINLRKGPDPEDKRFGADYWQFAVSNDHEKYDTTNPVVRRWLNEVMDCLSKMISRFPVLFHCTSGKDRTGVVVAAILTVLGVERELIVREYLWSEGDVERTWIEGSLDGIGDPQLYFHKVRLDVLRRKILVESLIAAESGGA